MSIQSSSNAVRGFSLLESALVDGGLDLFVDRLDSSSGGVFSGQQH
jgi:hypothetical protein